MTLHDEIAAVRRGLDEVERTMRPLRERSAASRLVFRLDGDLRRAHEDLDDLAAEAGPVPAQSVADFLGDWWHCSPALLILPFPLGFRLTCYYYRKAYYRSFWLSPPACAVADAHRRYTGERRFPLIFQNVHRYFFYLALPFAVLLT